MSPHPPLPPAALIRPALDAIGTELATRLPLPDPRPPMAPTYDTGASASERIAVSMARLEERQAAMQEQYRANQAAAEARHGQIVTMLTEFVPRTEIEAKQAGTNRRIAAIEDRVEKIEGRSWKVIAWVFGTIGSAIAGAVTLHFKGG